MGGWVLAPCSFRGHSAALGPGLGFTQSLPCASSALGLGAIGGVREGLPPSGRPHRLRLARTPGVWGKRGPFWRRRQQRGWAGGWGPGQRAFRPALCLQAGGGGRGAASSQTRRDHGPVFPECSGCQAQRAHFPERVIAARACRVAGSLAGAEGVIRALALGLELRARPGISGVDGLCLFLGSEGALERKTKKRLVQFLFWCHTDILKIVGPPRQRKSPETRSIWR